MMRSMSITDRLLAFSLGALAVVLVAFSVSVYLLVADHAAQQVEDRAIATLDTLAAQCRWRPDGLEWTGESWDIAFGTDGEPTIWGVFDASGHCLQTSRDLTFPIATVGAGQGLESGMDEILWMDRPWVLHRRRIVHSEPAGKFRTGAARNRYAALTLVTAWPYHGVIEQKRNLLRFLGFVSFATWSIALAAGRWYCKRALSPLREMAESVRAIDADNLSYRLPKRLAADELQALTLAFEGLMDRLEEAFVRQTRFVSEASHQLRTPLAALLGQMEVALRRDRDAPEYRRTLEVARGSAQRLQKIVESLLFLARREGTGPIVERETLDLAAWLPDHLRQNWSDHARSGDLRIGVLTAPDEPVTIRTHSAMLGQALDNFLDNAMKYGDAGTPVEVRLRLERGQALIEVADQGQGMDEDALSHVFEPFYRSEDARRRGIEGLGLGLAIVARLANVIGAVTEVESRPHLGSTFRLKLDLTDSPKMANSEEIERISERQDTVAIEDGARSA
ncbi:HAMP domain-containing protein [bacterium]|nr:HAMP domain-containing protein [bacterium]